MWFVSTQPPYGTSMPQSGRRPQHHFRQIETLPALAACLLCPESGQTGRRLTKSALCQKQTRAPEQSLSFEHLVGAQHKLGW